MPKHTNPQRDMLITRFSRCPTIASTYSDHAPAALGRTPKWRRDRRPLTTHSDASFLQIAAGPGNLRFSEDSIWRISAQMFKRAKLS